MRRKPREPGHTKPRRRGLWLLLTLVGLVLGLNTALDAPQVRRWLTEQVRERIADATGEDVLLGNVRIELLPLRATLDGLVIRSAARGDTLVALERARARVGLRLSGPRLLVLEVDRPLVRLRVVNGALVDFPGLSEGDVDKPLELPDELPWDELVLRQGDVRLDLVSQDDEGTERVITMEAHTLNLRPEIRAPLVELSIGELALSSGGLKQSAYDVRFPEAQIGPDRVVLPDVDIDFPVLRLTGNAGARLGGELGGDITLALRADALNELIAPGPQLIGDVDVDLHLGGPVEDPVVQLALAASPVLLTGAQHQMRYEFGSLVALALLRREGAEVQRFVAEIAGGRVEGEGKLDWAGGVEHATLRIEDLNFGRVMAELGDIPGSWVDFQADGEVNVGGTWSPLLLRGPFEVNVADFKVASGPPKQGADLILGFKTIEVAGELRLRPDDIRLDARRLAGGNTRGRADALLGWGEEDATMDIDVDVFDAALADFQPLGGAELGGHGRVTGRLVGPMDAPVITGHLSATDFACVGVPWADTLETDIHTDDLVNLDFPGFRGLKGETTLQGDIRLVFGDEFGLETQTLVNGKLSDLVGMFVELPGPEARVDGALSLAGPVYQMDGEATLNLSEIDMFGEPFERGHALGIMKKGRFTLDHLRMDRAQGKESLLARGSVGAGYATHVEVLSDGLRLETMTLLERQREALAGRVSLDAVVDGTLMSPEPRGRVSAAELRLAGRDLPDARVDFETREELLRFSGGFVDQTLVLEGSQQIFGDQSWQISMQAREFPAEILAPIEGEGQPVRASVSGRMQASGAFALEELATLDAELDTVELRWSSLRLANPEPWIVELQDGILRTEGLRLTGDSTDLSAAVGLDRSGKLLIMGGGPLELRVLVPLTEDYATLDGAGRLDVALSGDLRGLEGHVGLTMRDATVRSPDFPHPFERVDARIEGDSRSYSVLTSAAELGGGPVTLAGTVTAERWIPVAYDLHATAKGSRVHYIEDLPAMVVDADLDVDGPADELLLSGDLVVQEMVFTDRLDWEQWAVDFREQRLSGIVAPETGERGLFDLDLRVKANGTIRVRNNLADGVADADLRVVGDTGRAGMVGEVRMKPGGRFFYEDRTFDISRAELHYLDPWSYDPDLDFVLETDIRSNDRTYHVVLPVGGPFSDWRAEPRSDPPLAQGDINALILFGVTREEIERVGGSSSAIAMEGLDLLLSGEGQRALDRWGGSAVRQVAAVDLVTGVSARGGTLSSEWRVLVEKQVPEPWDLTFVGEFNPFRLDDQYLAMEKQLTNNVYLNLYWASYQRERNLAIGGAYGADFRVRWEVE